MANASTAARAASSEISLENSETYARIGDVARNFGVTLRALRFYEDKGLLQPERNGNTRLYTQRDRTRLRLILLGRRVGFSLREVKQMLDLYDPAGNNSRQLRTVLERSQRQRGRLQMQRNAIDEALRDLDQLIADVRSQLGGARAVAG